MTIPIERSWAVRNVRLFLWSLLDPKETPRVPREIRLRARRLLKHYPNEFDVSQMQKKAPELWGKDTKKVKIK